MTTTEDPDGGMVRGFPTPGPLLATAFLDLYLAAEGDEHQKAAIGDPNLLPKPWDPPTCRDPHLRAELWEWLDQVVLWLNHEYVWDPDGMIPPCWPQHPHLGHELAVLADQRRRVGLGLDSNGLEEWHRYTLPGFLDRQHARLKAHCDQDHQPWPARGRHARHADQRQSKRRQDAYIDDVRTPWPAEPYVPARPRLSIIDSATGEITNT